MKMSDRPKQGGMFKIRIQAAQPQPAHSSAHMHPGRVSQAAQRVLQPGQRLMQPGQFAVQPAQHPLQSMQQLLHQPYSTQQLEQFLQQTKQAGQRPMQPLQQLLHHQQQQKQQQIGSRSLDPIQQLLQRQIPPLVQFQQQPQDHPQQQQCLSQMVMLQQQQQRKHPANSFHKQTQQQQLQNENHQQSARIPPLINLPPPPSRRPMIKGHKRTINGLILGPSTATNSLAGGNTQPTTWRTLVSNRDGTQNETSSTFTSTMVPLPKPNNPNVITTKSRMSTISLVKGRNSTTTNSLSSKNNSLAKRAPAVQPVLPPAPNPSALEPTAHITITFGDNNKLTTICEITDNGKQTANIVNTVRSVKPAIGSSQSVHNFTVKENTYLDDKRDNSLVFTERLRKRLRIQFSKYGMESPSEEIVQLIQNACEDRLRTIIEKVAYVVTHRSEQIRADPLYLVDNDVRNKLQYLANSENAAKQRNQELADEKMYDSIRQLRGDEVETQRLKHHLRAKEIAKVENQRIECTNKTAIEAIGLNKTNKFNWLDGGIVIDKDKAVQPSLPEPRTTVVPRTKRLTMRDLVFYFEQDPVYSRSKFLYNTYLKMK